MIRSLRAALSALLLSACAAQIPPPAAQVPAAPIEVQILAINDFHGNIETPSDAVSITQPDGTVLKTRAGGAAQLASALEQARQGHPTRSPSPPATCRRVAAWLRPISSTSRPSMR